MITYQPITGQDVEKIFQLLKEHILQYENLEQIDCEKVFPWCRRKIEQMKDDYRRILCDGELAGYFATHEESAQASMTLRREIDDLYLLPPFRGKGIGTAVLKQVIAQAQRDGEPLFLYVFIRNKGAVRLYRRLGFGVAKNVKNSRYIMEYCSGQEK